MSSESDFQQSSSSSMESPLNKKEVENDPRQKSRSRSRDRKKLVSRDQNKYKSIYRFQVGESRKTHIKRPQLSQPLMSFKNFALSQVEKISQDKLKREYQLYKRDWQENQNESFVRQHRDDTWFIEKYHPDNVAENQRLKRQNANTAAKQFFEKLENVYCEINLTVEDPTSLGFISNMDREQDQETSVIPINSQSVDIVLNSDVDITKSPYFGFDPDYLTLFIKAVPKNISRSDIYQVFSKFPGFKSIFLSGPVKKLSFARYCWVTFQDEKSFKNAQVQVSGLMINKEPLTISSSSSKNRRIKILKKYPKSRQQKDAQAALKLIKNLDQEKGIQKNPLTMMQFSSEQKRFDIYILYLRKVHGYDYFSGCEFQNERALSLKLGLSFLRVENDYEQLPDIATVFKRAEQTAIKRSKQKNEFDPIGNLREQIQSMILAEQNITEEQKDQKTKWDCNYCDKKFRTLQFLSKHIIGKHPQIKEKSIKPMMQKMYLKDPNKITSYMFYKDDREYRRRGGYRRDRRRDYHDLDEPEGQKIQKIVNKPVVNFLDI